MIDVKNVSKFYKLSKKQRKEMGADFKEKNIVAVNDISFSCSQVEFLD